MGKVAIIGAGLSGLATAFRLSVAVPGVRIRVLENDTRTGGNIGTLDRDGFRVEMGPNGFLDSKPGTMKLCRDLGLADRLILASEGSRKNRYVFWNGQIHKLPGSPLSLLTTPLLTIRGKIELLAEPFRRVPANPKPDESVATFAKRRMGKEAATVFMDALVTGIHAADPERLSVRAAFPRLAKFEAENGGVLRGVLASGRQKKRDALARGEKPTPQQMWSFREGLRVLTDTMRDRLSTSITVGVPVKKLCRNGDGWTVHADGQTRFHADAVVLTCPAYEQAACLADLDPKLAEDLNAIDYNKIAVVALGYKQADCPGDLDGFGYIAPQGTRRDVLGVQWCSSIFPDRAPPGFVLWRVLCGGVKRADVYDWDDETLLRKCHAEMQLALHVRGAPVFTQVVRWPKAIPQYNLGHLDRVQRIEDAVNKRAGLFVTGNAFHGVTMNDVTEQAERVANQVRDFLTKYEHKPAIRGHNSC